MGKAQGQAQAEVITEVYEVVFGWVITAFQRQCLFICPPWGKAPQTSGSKKRLSPFIEKSLDLCRDLRDKNMLVLCPSAPFLYGECICPWRRVPWDAACLWGSAIPAVPGTASLLSVGACVPPGIKTAVRICCFLVHTGWSICSRLC